MSITKVYYTKKGADFSEMKQKTPCVRLLSLLLALMLLLCGCARPVFAETDDTVTEADIVIETERSEPPTDIPPTQTTAVTETTVYVETTAAPTADTSHIITESAVTETEAVIAATTAVTEATPAPTTPTRIAVPRMY